MKPLFRPSNVRCTNSEKPSLAMAQMAKRISTPARAMRLRTRSAPMRSSHRYPSPMDSLTLARAAAAWSPLVPGGVSVGGVSVLRVLIVVLLIAEIGAPDGVIVAELVGGSREHDLSCFQHVGVVGDLEGQVGVLLDDEHGDSLVGVDLTEASE